MVSSFYGITDFIAKVSLGHPSVKSFGFGSVDEIDTKKNTLFPHAYLTVNDIVISEGKSTYSLTYFVMDRVVDVTADSTGSLNQFEVDYRGIDNSIDVWNTSFEVASDVYSHILRNPDVLDYEIDGDATVTPFKDRFQNLLAGIGMDFSVVVSNNNNICTITP